MQRVLTLVVLLTLVPLLKATSDSLCGASAHDLLIPPQPRSGHRHLMPRDAAPAWTAMAVMPNQKFEKLSLSNYKHQWVVLAFYPYDFTFVCPTEIIGYSEAVAEFAKLNTQVLMVSTDSHHTHLAWIKTPRKDGGLGQVNMPLVADTSKIISRKYGVLVEDENDPMFGAALRGLFLSDPRGTVRFMSINDDSVGRSVDETLRLIKAFQFADEHGEVCPANWKPGDATIKPDPSGAKEYFSHKFSE